MSGGSRDANYDNVNMDMSSSDNDSDNEMFANKSEYEAFKNHFKQKSSKPKATVGTGEYGEDVEDESEYGGGSNKISTVGSKYGHDESLGSHSAGSSSSVSTMSSVMKTGDKKVERKPMLYGEDKKMPERRSKSRDRHHHRQRSNDRRDERRRRSRDRRRSRSRSRSPYRGDRDRGRDYRGGRHRGHDRRREREEGARNHEQQMERVREMGVEIPKYLKPGAVNPLSYAEQMQKRKALWAKPSSNSSHSEDKQEKSSVEVGKVEAVETAAANTKHTAGGSYNNWESTNFGNDKVNEKFRRLMGIKSGGGGGGKDSGGQDHAHSGGGHQPNHDKIMSDLDRNYEAARQQTHRNRGIGLGFADGGLGSTVDHNPAPPAPHTMMRNTGWQHKPPSSSSINFVRKQ